MLFRVNIAYDVCSATPQMLKMLFAKMNHEYIIRKADAALLRSRRPSDSAHVMIGDGEKLRIT